MNINYGGKFRMYIMAKVNYHQQYWQRKQTQMKLMIPMNSHWRRHQF